MARRWPPPCYETEEEVGLPHERQFAIACLVATYRETGRGKSKKVAKRLAAQQMWQRLQDLPADADGGGGEEVSSIPHFTFHNLAKFIKRITSKKNLSVFVSSVAFACPSGISLLTSPSIGSSETGSIYQSTQFLSISFSFAINRQIDSF